MKTKKIVCFGGGGALPKVILEPLKSYPAKISSVTSMTDDGGSTGFLRRELGVLPPGDIRRHILAFSEAPQWKKNLWDLRFGGEKFEGGHSGHSFANIFIAGIEKNLKKYDKVLEECCRFMEVPGKYKPLPATLSKVVLCAELEDGTVIEGESEIDVPKMHDANLKIVRIFLKPQAKAYGGALAAVAGADALVFGPGDLYSSVLACFLPAGMKSAISKSKAKKILVCNAMNKKGETDGFSAADFAAETEKYAGAQLDYILYNNKAPNGGIAEKAREKDASLSEPVSFGGNLDARFIGMDLLKKSSVSHDPGKTGKIVWELIVQ